MLIGNDVVDLTDAECSLNNLHSRFMDRVFSARERETIFASPDPKRTLWLHWAAKESAYKAAVKGDPELTFSPRRFRVRLQAGYDAWPRGTVEYGAKEMQFRGSLSRYRVHVVAASKSVQGSRALESKAVFRIGTGSDASVIVREAARAALAWRLGCSPSRLGIRGSRPPRVIADTAVLEESDFDILDLSLSHHGAWGAYAALLVEKPRGPRELWKSARIAEDLRTSRLQ